LGRVGRAREFITHDRGRVNSQCPRTVAAQTGPTFTLARRSRERWFAVVEK
jgi:hypothetical protein